MKVVLGDVAVVVADARASAKWWKKLGFEVRDDVGHWITVAPPGSNVVIHLCAGQGFPPETGNTGIGFFVDDVRAVHEAWSKKGVAFTKPPTQETASVNAMFADADGNEYWLFEDEDLRETPKPGKKAAKKTAKAPKRRVKKVARKKTPAKKRR